MIASCCDRDHGLGTADVDEAPIGLGIARRPAGDGRGVAGPDGVAEGAGGVAAVALIGELPRRRAGSHGRGNEDVGVVVSGGKQGKLQREEGEDAHRHPKRGAGIIYTTVAEKKTLPVEHFWKTFFLNGAVLVLVYNYVFCCSLRRLRRSCT